MPLKFQRLTQVLSGFMITLSATALIHPASTAQTSRSMFYCGTSLGHPATVARTPRGNLPVIRWTSDHFSGSGWSPQRRCQAVSERFQDLYSKGQLRYITTGLMNRQPVVCVASRRGGDCTGLLFTLKQGSNPGQTLGRLLNYRALAVGNALNESGGERVYIDVEEYLNTAEVEGENTPTPQPSAEESEQNPWWYD